MGLDGEVLHARMIGQDDRHHGREPAPAPVVIEQVRDGAGTGASRVSARVDGGGERRRP